MGQSKLAKILGWGMAICFITCSFPQVIKTYQTGNVSGISIDFWFLWGLGELLGILYILVDYFDLKRTQERPRFQWPLFANYIFCLLLIILEMTMYYHFN